MKSYFSNHYTRLSNIDTSDESSIHSWYNSRILEYDNIIENLQVDLNRSKILEIGCGIGGFLNYLHKKGHTNFIGIDISEEQVNICKKYSSNNVILENALTFLEKANTYDYIFAFDMIEHIEKNNLEVFIKYCYESLNNGGKLILRTPNMSTPFSIFSRYIDFTHEIGFTEFSLRQLLCSYFDDRNIFLFNERISLKKKIVQRLINNAIEKIYDLPKRQILTSNIYLKAKKGNIL